MRSILPLNLITFLAAFLLFQIELIVAKLFLPNYGGSYLVWGSCIVFFQTMLLLGYAFAHAAIRYFGISRYRIVHAVLILIPFLFFPGRSLAIGDAGGVSNLSLNVFLKLCVTIGPVFFVLSTASLVFQVFLSRSSLQQKKNPYALYAVSNLGSFSALLSYPFVFECFLSLSQQLWLWRGLYVFLVVLQLAVFVLIRVADKPAAESVSQKRLVWYDVLRWLVLGAAGSVMFLSVNNIITTETSPVPLLWILPLCIYLFSFVLNFKQNPWCPSWIVSRIHLILVLCACVFFFVQKGIFSFAVELILLSGGLFVLCMYCQNRLMAYKPIEEQRLTLFYVVFSFGSCLGGFLTSWIIPKISVDLIEYLIGMMIITAVLPGERAARSRWHYAGWIAVGVILWGMGRVWPLYYSTLTILIFLIILVFMVRSAFRRDRMAILLGLAVAIGVFPVLENTWMNEKMVTQRRNYYGVYRVIDSLSKRTFYHGMTVHGTQSLDASMEHEPTMYYGHTSPIGEVLGSNEFHADLVGAVGLGVGTIAAYGRPGQIIDFYELDPDVVDIAQRHFSFLKNSKAMIHFIPGDARQSLAERPSARYDVMIIDAFSGDAVPVHLLTAEMILMYQRHLRDKGVIFFHTSNRYISLYPIIARNALLLGADVCFKFNRSPGPLEAPSEWVMVSWDHQRIDHMMVDGGWRAFDFRDIQRYKPWTDDYSTILPVIRWGALMKSDSPLGNNEK